MRSHFPIFCLYTRSNFSFMETVKMSFHSPTLPGLGFGIKTVQFMLGHESNLSNAAGYSSPCILTNARRSSEQRGNVLKENKTETEMKRNQEKQ